MTAKTTEHLIIGFGKAGKTLAVALAKAGKQVILVEKSPLMYGGTCINIGCIPSKKLFELSKKDTQFPQAVEQKDELIAQLNKANYKKVADACEVITGQARFIDEHTVAIEPYDGEQVITVCAEYIYINTGAYNWQPPIEGLKDSPYAYDSTALMNLKTTPKDLVVIGGGYIGLEFAFTMTQFGSKVVILETADVFLPREDEDIKQSLLEIMDKKGITVKVGQTISSVAQSQDGVMVKTDNEELKADAILVATGRRANIQGLDLDKAGVDLTDKGYIKTNEHLQTTQPHIYAMGDVAGSPQFTYMSLDDYRIVANHILKQGALTTKDRTYPYAVFTNPPLAVTGLSEKLAKEQGYTVKVAKLPASAIPKAKILTQTEGLLKAVVDAKTDKILGVQLLCNNAHEMINFMDLAIRQELTYQEVRDYIFTHPTMIESLNELFLAID